MKPGTRVKKMNNEEIAVEIDRLQREALRRSGAPSVTEKIEDPSQFGKVRKRHRPPEDRASVPSRTA